MGQVKKLIDDAIERGYAYHKDHDMKDLIDRVLDQIKKDVEDGDLTAVAEMLTHVANKHLEGYLPDRDLFNEGETK